MNKENVRKAKEALQAVIELDFPFKVEKFLFLQKDTDKTVIGQIATTDGAIYVFRIDTEEMRPMLKRQY
jgi:hypothetical protein